MRIRLAIAAAFALAASFAPQARASYFIGIAHGDPSAGQATGFADRTSFGGLPVFATFTYNGPIDFVNNNPDNSQNTFANFFDFANITGYHGVTGPATLAGLAPLIMSNPGPSEGTCAGAGETGCLVTDLIIIGHSGGGVATVLHDDGASLYSLPTLATVFESSDPTAAITSTGVLPAGFFRLYYVEANGSPSVLTLNIANVPEPAGVAVLGAGLLGLGLIRRRA